MNVTPRQLKAVIHSRSPLYEGFLRLYQYEFDVEKHGGGIKRTSWEMMERGNALVAGTIENDETVLQAAVREMREETGLDLSDPVLIHPGAYVSSGGTSEKIAIVYGTVDTSQAGGVAERRSASQF
jgi:hypothetical protein